MPRVEKQQPTTVNKSKKTVTGIGARIKPVVFDEDDGIRILLYGRSGSGKTTLWSTFPGPILALVCSGGEKPGELRSLGKEARKKTSVLEIRSSKDFVDAIELQMNEQEFKTIVLDHVSGFCDLVLAEILGLDEPIVQKSWGLASQQQYGQLSLKVKEMLRRMLSLSCNTVIIGQERETNTERDDELLMPSVGVATTPAIAGWLNPACDYVCQTFIRPRMEAKEITIGGRKQTKEVRGDGVEYCLRCAPHDVFTTKFRVPRGSECPDVIVDPSYDKIMEAISQ